MSAETDPTTVNLPAAFYFKVNVGAETNSQDASFQEVSGMDLSMETEDYNEGGENRFVHKLPKGIKQQSLSLKRGISELSSPLVIWCKATLEGGLAIPIVPQPITVTLQNANSIAVRTWSFTNAYPVRWEIESFLSTKNEVAIEHIELAYQTVTRVL